MLGGSCFVLGLTQVLADTVLRQLKGFLHTHTLCSFGTTMLGGGQPGTVCISGALWKGWMLGPILWVQWCGVMLVSLFVWQVMFESLFG